ncbi:MAG: sugar transferase [Chitinophagaceae bacterium]
MFVDSYPTTTSIPAVQYGRSEAQSFENRKAEHKYFYISSDSTSSEALHRFFPDGIFTDTFEEARRLIMNFRKNDAPDVIFIDMPWNRSGASKFCLFLKDQASLAKTVIIYNELKLDASAIIFLKQNQLVDEVVSIQSSRIDYARKVEFLKKIKSRQHKLTVSWNGLNKNFPQQIRDFAPIKRTIDIVLATGAIICLSPLFLLVSLAIRLESRGPIIYAAPRAGKGFRVFKFYKFRTMVADADTRIQEVAHLNQYTQDNTFGAQFLKISNDPRVTRIGRILRKTSLDEIPQFFNVLKGDMSFVGNRPLPLYEASTLTTNESVERFMAPAGITGLWQIKKRGRENMSAEERIKLDITYARKHSVAYDFWIMANTPGALLQKSDA